MAVRGGGWTGRQREVVSRRNDALLVPLRTRVLMMTMSATDEIKDGGEMLEKEQDDVQEQKKEVHVDDGEFLRRFGDLKGKPVEPVSASVARFNELFARPVPIVYRGIITELISTTHLAIVCAMWRFDSVFALGFDATFETLLKYYPNADERDRLYQAACGALKLDVAKVRREAKEAREWVEGKTPTEILEQVKTAQGVKDGVVGALTYVRDAGKFDWYYSRVFGIGLIEIMTITGAELSGQEAENWADQIGLDKAKFGAEMGTYLGVLERLKQAEQIFAEAAAREKKKMAERLAEKAQKAVKEAEMLEKGEQVGTETSSTE